MNKTMEEALRIFVQGLAQFFVPPISGGFFRTRIEAPLSATSAEVGLGLGLGLGLGSLARFSLHSLPFFSSPSFHTLSLSPAFTSVWWSD